MKPVHAMSYREFCHTMEYNKIDDSNVEAYPSGIIEIMGEQDLLFFPFWFKQNHSNVLRLCFDDVDEPLNVKLLRDIEDKREYIPVVAMSHEQGKEIVSFVKANEDKKSFIIHCAAGVSRSAGVALFINDYFSGDWYHFKQVNPNTKPNIRIVKILTKIAKL
jgi:predicted protein tyrosine phosphatase